MTLALLFGLTYCFLALLSHTLIMINAGVPRLFSHDLLVGIFNAPVEVVMAEKLRVSGDWVAPKVRFAHLVV